MKKTTAYPIFFSIYTFLISLVIYPYYKNGDQRYYRLAYDEIHKMSFMSGFEYYSNLLGTKEPTYFIISKFLSPLIDKDILMSLINSLLALTLTSFLIKRKTHILVIVLIFSNFYLNVIFFAAERLKISLLFAIIPVAIDFRWKYYFHFLSILTHIQVALLTLGQAISNKFILTNKIQTLKSTISIKNIIIVSIFSGLVYYLWEHIVGKFTAYSTEGSSPYEIGVQAIFKPLIFLILCLFYCRGNKIKPLIENLPIIVASYFIGSERIVMFSYIIFMNYALKINRGLNIGVAVTSVYFIIKNYQFVYNILNFGNGFHGS